MAILPILETPDPVLREISKPVTEFSDALKKLVSDMFETMYDAPGIGLAAVQVGVPLRVLVIDLQEPDPDDEEGKRVVRDPQVFINPVFSDPSEELNHYQEGCLSVPEQYADVVRPLPFFATKRPGIGEFLSALTSFTKAKAGSTDS